MLINIQQINQFLSSELSVEQISASLVQSGIEVESITDDKILDLSITPNRGDCLSAYGIARQVGAILNVPVLTLEEFINNRPAVKNLVPNKIKVQLKSGCQHYSGQMITNLNPQAKLPDWLGQELIVYGLNISNYPIVDILNYVMLTCGQPMHAFDLEKIGTNLAVGLFSDASNSSFELLDKRKIQLHPEDLVITDDVGYDHSVVPTLNKENILAIAGVMGGNNSAISEQTTGIFLESACFDAVAVRMSASRYKLNTDSSYRFSRGVDSELQNLALEYAVRLILEICGTPETMVSTRLDLKINAESKPAIKLRPTRVNKLLGTNHSVEYMIQNLQRLNIKIIQQQDYLLATVPSYRSDLTIEEDLIEEIAIMTGYDNLPSVLPNLQLQFENIAPDKKSVIQIKYDLAANGLHEIINYSFISPIQVQELGPTWPSQSVALANPLSNEWSVMRPSLIPGVWQTIVKNQQHQQDRVRVFEIGVCFSSLTGKIQDKQETVKLAIGLSGLVAPEHWSGSMRNADFYDLKKLIHNLFTPQQQQQLEFISDQENKYVCLDRNCTATIVLSGKSIGIIGQIDSKLLHTNYSSKPIFIAEIELDSVLSRAVPKYAQISKFPSVRRDLALLLERKVKIQDLQHTVWVICGDLLVDCIVFDIYNGKNIPAGQQSVALGLVLQSMTETLTDVTVNSLIEQVISELSNKYKAALRS